MVAVCGALLEVCGENVTSRDASGRASPVFSISKRYVTSGEKKLRFKSSEGTMNRKRQKTTDQQHPEHASESKNQNVQKSFKRRSNRRKNQEHQRRAACSAVHHADQQWPEAQVRPARMIMGPLFTVGVNVPVRMRYSSAVHMRVGMQLDLPFNCSNQYSRAQR